MKGPVTGGRPDVSARILFLDFQREETKLLESNIR
jgi:hypothetical protein